MKNNSLIICTLIFFFLVNTQYYWEIELDILAIPVTLVLLIGYFVLVVVFLNQLYLLLKEKFKNKKRVLSTCLLTTVLVLTFFKPFGIINFERLRGNDVLIAQIEGVANCMSTLRLKEGNTFTQRTYCFGAYELSGTYFFKNDTIYFNTINQGRYKHAFYQFAVIGPSDYNNNSNGLGLMLYKKRNDTIGINYWIEKVDIQKLRLQKVGRKV